MSPPQHDTNILIKTDKNMHNLRALAFYLPQFHPIPENDEWWGKGFTEWRNVAKARPLFPGHYQPHLPADLGFYDLRLPEVREAQAELARQYGIHGFCYYHYWFNGRRILERPFNEILASGKPNFPFCLCWANENWTRAWDGKDRQVLLAQNYSCEDDIAHIRSLIRAFRDERYIRVEGKPLFLVYRSESLPNPARTMETWREEARRAGIGDLYLVRVESFVRDQDPRALGFDAAVEFAPDWRNLQDLRFRDGFSRFLMKARLLPNVYLRHEIVTYEGMVRRMLEKPEPSYPWFRCVTPGFDNSARRVEGAAILLDNTPEKYGAWLREAIHRTLATSTGDRRIVFINAWNEWGEGNHLEPDVRYGRAFLEATRQALETAGGPVTPPAPVPATLVPAARKLYWNAISRVRGAKELVRHMIFGRD